jgi:hypothetical protein
MAVVTPPRFAEVVNQIRGAAVQEGPRLEKRSIGPTELSKEYRSERGWSLWHPPQWTHEAEDEETIRFFNPQATIGILRISRHQLRPDAPPDSLEGFLERQRRKLPQSELKSLGDKRALYYTTEAEEGGEPIVLHGWFVGRGRDIVTASYVVRKADVDSDAAQAEVRLLPQILESVTFHG